MYLNERYAKITKEIGAGRIFKLLTIKNYVRAESLEEAYELNQKRSNAVLGGMVWMKMSTKNIQTAIDLSGLGLDTIEENDHDIRIGAMCTLRRVETDPVLEREFQGQIRESLRHIVGVQFRNTATIGGSIFGRFGFSDILTCLLVLNADVELHHGGIVPLAEFVKLPWDNDILVRIIIRKDGRKVYYQSFRRTKTDLPILASAAGVTEDKLYLAFGARPMRAALMVTAKSEIQDEEGVKQFARQAVSEFSFGSNMRGSAEYRRHLAQVSVCRAIKALEEEFSW